MKVLLCLLLLQSYLSCWLGLHLQYTKSCNLRFPYFSPIWKWELVGERKGLVFCVHSARHEVKTDIFHGNDNKCFNNSQCDNFLQKCLICNNTNLLRKMYKTLLCLVLIFDTETNRVSRSYSHHSIKGTVLLNVLIGNFSKNLY